MLNITEEVKGDKLILTVDLSQRHGPSSSGKTTQVASTRGNAKLTGKHAGVMYGLNVYTKQ